MEVPLPESRFRQSVQREKSRTEHSFEVDCKDRMALHDMNPDEQSKSQSSLKFVRRRPVGFRRFVWAPDLQAVNSRCGSRFSLQIYFRRSQIKAVNSDGPIIVLLPIAGRLTNNRVATGSIGERNGSHNWDSTSQQKCRRIPDRIIPRLGALSAEFSLWQEEQSGRQSLPVLQPRTRAVAAVNA
jgi:hypothetical protein